MEFKVGDRVVYPNHGLGIIEQIQMRDSGEKPQEFLCLRILANDSTVMVPRKNTNHVGLRPVVSKKEVDQVFDVLKDEGVRIFDDWKGRFQENSDKMRSGSLSEVARVFKTLSQLANEKNLSYRERRMLDRAKYLIISEIAEVAKMTATEVEARVDRAIARATRPAPRER